jgi:hypothetical protein
MSFDNKNLFQFQTNPTYSTEFERVGTYAKRDKCENTACFFTEIYLSFSIFKIGPYQSFGSKAANQLPIWYDYDFLRIFQAFSFILFHFYKIMGFYSLISRFGLHVSKIQICRFVTMVY